MRQVLQLDSPEALPADFRDRLAPHRTVFIEKSNLDDVLADRGVRQIAQDLDDHLKQQWIHGYHCTRQPHEGFFERRGLRVTDIAAHQEEFLATFGDRFTRQEIDDIQASWGAYFGGSQARSRNGRVWACLTRSLVTSSGTRPLFEYFGGEALSMPLGDHPTVSAKLRALGDPVVVEVALPGSELKASYEMSRAVLSRYHARLKPDARIDQSEGRMHCAIPPEDVLRVTPRSEFVA